MNAIVVECNWHESCLRPFVGWRDLHIDISSWHENCIRPFVGWRDLPLDKTDWHESCIKAGPCKIRANPKSQGLFLNKLMPKKTKKPIDSHPRSRVKSPKRGAGCNFGAPKWCYFYYSMKLCGLSNCFFLSKAPNPFRQSIGQTDLA